MAGWLCLLAVWLQVLLPVAMHSAAMADSPSILVSSADTPPDDGCALEHAGHHHHDDGQADPMHGHGVCLACQAMHFMGAGVTASGAIVPPAVLVRDVSMALARAAGAHGFDLPRFFQARAPPAVSI
jgi:hypothetical protein